MLIRCAFFEGRVRDGKEAAFEDFVQQQLLPLWRRFPGSTGVRVLHHVAADPTAPPIHMMLEFDYPSQADIDRTMASPERTEAKAKTQELLSMFDGRLYHVVFERKD
jgi:hypothetical protein